MQLKRASMTKIDPLETFKVSIDVLLFSLFCCNDSAARKIRAKVVLIARHLDERTLYSDQIPESTYCDTNKVIVT
jgi:hypothetical protein